MAVPERQITAMTIKEDVRSIVEGAFSSAVYPGDSQIVPSGPNARGVSKEVADYLRGRDWRELSPRDIFWLQSALSMMTAEAVAYYLPAFLLGCLKPQESDVGSEFAILDISPPPHGFSTMAEFEHRISLLTDVQLTCVGKVFRYLAATYPQDYCNENNPNNCLTDYYEKYLPEPESEDNLSIQTVCERYRKLYD